MAEQVRVRCRRCDGTGSVAHRTARFDARCYCCGGVGHYFRSAPRKRPTEAELAARHKAETAALHEWARKAARGA